MREGGKTAVRIEGVAGFAGSKLKTVDIAGRSVRIRARHEYRL
jgi:hypothetical protein